MCVRFRGFSVFFSRSIFATEVWFSHRRSQIIIQKLPCIPMFISTVTSECSSHNIDIIKTVLIYKVLVISQEVKCKSGV